MLTSISTHPLEMLRTPLGWTADGYRPRLEVTLVELLLAGAAPR